MKFPLRSRIAKRAATRRGPAPAPQAPPRLRPAILEHERLAAEDFLSGFTALEHQILGNDGARALISSGDLAGLIDLIDLADLAEFEEALVVTVTDRVKDVIEFEGDAALTQVRLMNQAMVQKAGYPSNLPDTTFGDPLPEPGRSGFYATARFDMTNPFAIIQAERFAAELVREVSRGTRAAIRQAVVDAFNNGITGEELARLLRNTVGLTRLQAQAVENYRFRLLEGGMDPERVDVLTRRYHRKTLIRRTQTIARTEIMRASNYGRLQGWLSAGDAGMLDVNASTKEWVTAPFGGSMHDDPCVACGPLDKTKVMGVETPFVMPNGKQLLMPPAHPNAVFFGSMFIPYGELDEMVRASYRGPCVRISAGSKVTTIGPNHPMLTRRGMVAARDLHEGDELVYDRRVDEARANRVREANLEQVVLVEDAFQACLSSGAHTFVASTGHDLHGDRVFCEGEVEVVVPEHGLLFVLDPCGIEERREGFLVEPDVESEPLPGDGPSDLPFDRVDSTASSGMGGFGAGNAHFEFLTVHKVDVGEFIGMAFDATTTSSLYCSDGFVVSNCRCTAVVWPPDPPEDWDPAYPFAQV